MEKFAPDERFLARWARRKAAVDSADGESAGADSAAAHELPAVAGDASLSAGETSAPALTDADMPPLDSLDEGSDFSGFLSPGVSEALRRRALRKLFACAVFNNRDGLDDYDDDFRHFPPLGAHITSDMKHRMEMEAERAEAEATVTESADEAGEETVTDTEADSPPDETPESGSPSPESPSPPPPDPPATL